MTTTQEKQLQGFSRQLKETVASPDGSVKEHIDYLTSELIIHQDPADRLTLLKHTLQQAVELEFGTIPVYLAALWSIKDNLDPIAVSIRNVVQEEMLHLALASNMLASIGGTPKIYDTSNKGLRFPARLPGGVHPELVLKLSALTNDALDDFLEIELPNEPITIAPYESKYHDAHNGSATIGALYDAINAEFQSLQPLMTPDKQVSGPLAWFVVDTIEKIQSAIHWIKEQGEGSIDNSPENTGLEKLSHFYRFWEVRRLQKIEQDATTGKYMFKSPLTFPEVWPMAVIPEGGYQENEVSTEVWELYNNFNLTYSKMIHTLESAWSDGGQAALWKAIDMMFDLEKYALPLMKIPKPDGSGNYGPGFRLIAY
jgi:rubrerythrin